MQRTDLTGEAVRLTRLLYRLLPGEGEVAGLLALMLLTDARRPRVLPAGGQNDREPYPNSTTSNCGLPNCSTPRRPPIQPIDPTG